MKLISTWPKLPSDTGQKCQSSSQCGAHRDEQGSNLNPEPTSRPERLFKKLISKVWGPLISPRDLMEDGCLGQNLGAGHEHAPQPTLSKQISQHKNHKNNLMVGFKSLIKGL